MCMNDECVCPRLFKRGCLMDMVGLYPRCSNLYAPSTKSIRRKSVTAFAFRPQNIKKFRPCNAPHAISILRPRSRVRISRETGFVTSTAYRWVLIADLSRLQRCVRFPWSERNGRFLGFLGLGACGEMEAGIRALD